MGTNRLVAVLFTDLVGSTELTLSLGPTAGDSFRRRHFARLHEATARFGGEVVKSTGDGIMATFPAAFAAVEAAISMQQAVSGSADMRVGLSVGDAAPEGGDWYGMPVIEAARLCEEAGAGQILATRTLVALADSRSSATFRPLGSKGLKGVRGPVETWEVCWEPAATSVRVPTDIALVGRSAELDELTAILQRPSADLRVAVVTGEAGIGKSALVSAVQGRARDLGLGVYAGRADELERSRPLRAIGEAFAIGATGTVGMREEVARALAAHPRTGGDIGYALADAATALVEEVATSAPALVVIEDIHWADPLTALALRQIVSRLTDLPVTLLLTLRSGAGANEASRWAIDLTLSEMATHVSLGPLDLDAVSDLAKEVLGRAPGPVLTAQLARAGGNPLYATELLRDFAAAGAFGADGDLAPGSIVPSSAQAAIRHRLAFLPEGTRRHLEIASVLGREFTIDDVRLLAPASAAGVVGELRPALDANVLHDAGPVLRFSHDLVRDAIYDGIPQAARDAMHRAVAEALAARGVPHAVIAAHLLRSPPQADEAYLDLLLSVGTALRQLAPPLAVELFTRGIETCGVRSPRYVDFARALLWPLILRGRVDEVDALLASLQGRPNVDADPIIREAVVYRHLRSGRMDLFRAELEALAEQPLEDEARAWVEARLLSARVLAGDAAAAASLRGAVSAHAATAEDERFRVYCLAVLTLLGCAEGDVAAAVAAAEAAEPLHRRLLGNVATVFLFIGIAMQDADRLDDGATAIEAGLAEDLEEGDVSSLSVQHWCLALNRYLAGDWDAAVAEVETGLELLAAGGQGPMGVLIGYAVLARISLHRGDIAAARGLVDHALTLLQQGVSPLGVELLQWANGLVLEAEGREDECWPIAGAAWNATAGIRYLLSWRTVAADLVRWALAAGDEEGAASVGEAVAEGARRAGGVASADAVALECAAMLTSEPASFVAALERLADAPRPVATALASERAAAALSTGDRPAALAHLDRALATWAALGATHDEARARAALRALGGRPGRTGRAVAKDVTGWESLSPAQLAVAQLLGEGLTNRQIGARLFISPHTVDTHVRHILRKLDVRSRVAVAVAARAATAIEDHVNA